MANSLGAKLVGHAWWARAAILAVVALSLGALWHVANRPNTPFLAQHPPAHWILYPSPDWHFGKLAAPLATVFRRSFELRQVPLEAQLAVRGFREVEVAVNGRVVLPLYEGGDDWKSPRRCDIAEYLRSGENEIVALVQNVGGPPALWCSLSAGNLQLVSDESWRCSCAGAVMLPATTLSNRTHRIELAKFRETTWESLTSHLPLLALFAGLAGIGWLAFEISSKIIKPKPHAESSTSFGWWILVATLAMWIALVANNHPRLPPLAGFDAAWHRHYIDHIQQHYSLPAANEGLQTHQAPLYYLLNAVLLEMFHEAVNSGRGLLLMRGLQLTFGLLYLYVIHLALRLLFPQRAICQIVGTLFAACLPVHLFIVQYTTNELLAALASAATVYLTLRAINQDCLHWTDGLWIGISLGAALSSKLTTLVLVPCVLVTLGILVLRRWPRPNWHWLSTWGLTVAVCLVVGGWHYARLWVVHDTPFVRQVDQFYRDYYWVQPGYRSIGHYGWPSEVLRDPFFAGVNSLADSLYSTFWGDGRWGGLDSARLRPPWHYGLMAAGYGLAVVPTLLILVGIIIATATLLRRFDLRWFLLLGVAWTMGVALVYESLQHPSFHVAKAWYALPAALPICAFLALAVQPTPNGSRIWRGTVCVLFGIWACCAFTSFWIPRNAPATLAQVGGALVTQQLPDAALNVLLESLAQHPEHAESLYWTGEAYERLGDLPTAAEYFEAAIESNPHDADARCSLAKIKARDGLVSAAESLLLEALQTSPDHFDSHLALIELYTHRGEIERALEHGQQATRLIPAARSLHTRIAELYARQNRYAVALRHCLLALRIEPSYDAAWELVAEIDPNNIQVDVALERGVNSIASTAHLAHILERLAWRAAIESETRPELSKVSERLALRAVRLRPLSPYALRALAASQAALRKFDQACDNAAHAQELALNDGNHELAGDIGRQLEAYRRQDTYYGP